MEDRDLIINQIRQRLEILYQEVDALQNGDDPGENYYTKQQVNNLLNGKVDVVAGKGLSANDYTNADKAAVGSISEISYNLGILESDVAGLFDPLDETIAQGGEVSATQKVDIGEQRPISMNGNVYYFNEDDGTNYIYTSYNDSDYSVSVAKISKSAWTVNFVSYKITNQAFDIGKSLSSDSNLDNVIAIGRYYYTTSQALTISNVPRTDCGGELIVEYIENSSTVRQTFIPNYNESAARRFYVRMLISNSWTSWIEFGSREVNLADTFGLPATIADNTDIFSLTTGRWRKTSNVSTVSNLPSDFSATTFYAEVVNSVTSSRRIIKLYPTAGTGVGSFYQNVETSSGFNGWYKFTGTLVANANANTNLALRALENEINNDEVR